LFRDVSALHAALLEKKPKDFVSHFMFDAVPYVFAQDLATWIDWKTHLADHLEVDPHDIVLTGSGAIGFSLNPNKNYKPFDGTSDIDCGVISPYHFEQSWRYLRQIRPSWLSLPPKSKRAIELHRKNLVFSGTIATDSILGLLPFGAKWQAGLDAMGRIAPTSDREVKLRVYKDYDALRSYHVHNIDRIRNELAESIGEAEPIDVEE
jgi:hypothetical protein